MKIDAISGGLAGKILRVDLSREKISTEDTVSYARRFIGGRTISSFILLNEVASETRWSDPENILIFGVGCLVGTLAPAACRISVDTQNAYNNGKGSANFGGHFGPELKYAGFDHVIITGKAETPVYLWIHDGNATLKDAASVWGKTTYETEEILQKTFGDKRIKVASIGPAGENLVRGAAVIGDCGKAAGGSGVGCVMGSKKLKALAVRGHGAIRVAQPERFFKVASAAFKKIIDSPAAVPLRKGLVESCSAESKLFDYYGIVRNGQDEYWPMKDRIRLISKDRGVPKYTKRVLAGFSCPVGDLPFFEVEEDKYKGTKGLGYWLNSVGYSRRLDVYDPGASLKFHLMANQLGLDGDMAAVSSAWAFECYERGLLTKEDTDGLELRWGSEDAMLKLEKKIAYRQGFGDFLADGVVEASRRLGRGSEKFAIHMKGQDTYENYRILKAWGFGCSTSLVGGRHLRGAVSTPESGGPPDLNWNPHDYKNVPEVVFWEVRAKEIEDMTGICNMVSTYGKIHALCISDFVELINSAMGVDLTEDELMLIAQRGVNLEKAFNTIHTDLARKDDLPPERYMEESIKSGPYAGYKCDKEEWDEMLDQFYELQGWDKETSLQTRRGLTELGGMDDIVRKLERIGKLID